MARRKPVADSLFVMFDVVYDDGRRTSNRKVPRAELGGPDCDNVARSFLEAQDNKIAEMSGSPRGMIKSIKRS
ncbi:MAG: hypothetical protein WCK65_09630 [Rhodospirillaceae bacterium]